MASEHFGLVDASADEASEYSSAFPESRLFGPDEVLTDPEDIRRGILQLLRQEGIRLVRESRP